MQTKPLGLGYRSGVLTMLAVLVSCEVAQVYILGQTAKGVNLLADTVARPLVKPRTMAAQSCADVVRGSSESDVAIEVKQVNRLYCLEFNRYGHPTTASATTTRSNPNERD